MLWKKQCPKVRAIRKLCHLLGELIETLSLRQCIREISQQYNIRKSLRLTCEDGVGQSYVIMFQI